MRLQWIAGVLPVASVVLPVLAGAGAITVACSAALLTLALAIGGFSYAPAQRMRSVALGVIAVATPLALVLLTIFVLIEQGETVVLRTFDADGTAEETRLWVVDLDGTRWLGAGGGDTRRWYQRLQAVPEVEMVRHGVARCFRADPERDPTIRDAVIELTRQKYRLGNAGLSIGNRLGIPMRENTIAIPVRLLPCDRASA